MKHDPFRGTPWKALATLTLFAFMLLSGCTGSPGSTYLMYYWVSAPLAILDTNPSTPAIIYCGEYFPTGTGTFHMEYVAWDGSAWWMDYTISSDPGGLFWSRGDDAWFEIDLFSTGPSFYRSAWEKSLEEQSANRDLGCSSGARSIVNSRGAYAGRQSDLPGPCFEQSRRCGSYTITGRYGRLPDQPACDP